MRVTKKMKLFDTLKQFKNIEPNAQFTQRSRTEILLSPQNERRTVRTIFTFLHTIEMGAAVALVGFFIFVFSGKFSPTRSIAPIQYAVIDPQGCMRRRRRSIYKSTRNIGYPQVTSTIATGSAIATPAALNNAFVRALARNQRLLLPLQPRKWKDRHRPRPHRTFCRSGVAATVA